MWDYSFERHTVLQCGYIVLHDESSTATNIKQGGLMRGRETVQHGGTSIAQILQREYLDMAATRAISRGFPRHSPGAGRVHRRCYHQMSLQTEQGAGLLSKCMWERVQCGQRACVFGMAAAGDTNTYIYIYHIWIGVCASARASKEHQSQVSACMFNSLANVKWHLLISRIWGLGSS